MSEKLSLYLHFPFCRQKCLYCDFHSISGQDELMPAYGEAIIREMERVLPQSRQITSVYFGGGTPSYLPGEIVTTIMNFIRQRFWITPQTEVTIEANPGTVWVDDLISLRAAGFNRLSFGVQAAQDRLLKILGRIHAWKEFTDIYELAREAGFANIGMDLIFGLPGQTMADWRESLARAVALQPEHISAYGLQLEPGTPLEKQITQGNLTLPAEDDTVAMFREVMRYLPAHGYEHYEVSNYARPGYYSRHNLGYWNGRDYLGFGSGASSKIYQERRENVKDVARYIQLVAAGESAVAQRETIDRATAMVEALMLGLRMRKGIQLERFAGEYGVDLVGQAAAEVDRFREQGLMIIEDGWLKLTDDGILVSNYVMAGLMGRLTS